MPCPSRAALVVVLSPRPIAGRRRGFQTTGGSRRHRAVPSRSGCSYDARLEFEFFHEFGRGFLGIAFEELGLFGPFGQVYAVEVNAGGGFAAAQLGGRQALHFLGFCLLGSPEGGVTQLAAARLNG